LHRKLKCQQTCVLIGPIGILNIFIGLAILLYSKDTIISPLLFTILVCAEIKQQDNWNDMNKNILA